ncbi:BspA family leucine-rich repeat surface protein [Lactococcus petauri]|uniref:BspA family leucine-rich repeat surface protein n=1 Tax=Lactococcus petauri TaxID=1940789 RepID=UPI0022E51FFE|nr:BspA family leucine-rich repeat surface protein [Lactococcus petauri]
MKVKKNKKMRFSSKSRYFLTLAVLAGLVGNPLLQEITVLAESFSPDTSLVTEDETQLPDVLNPKAPEIPDVSEDEDFGEERESSQVEDEDEAGKEAASEEKPVPPASEVRAEQAVPEISSRDVIWEGKIWGDVDVRLEWRDDEFGHSRRAVVVLGGTITDSRDFPWKPTVEGWGRWAIIFEGNVDVGINAEGVRSLAGLFNFRDNITDVWSPKLWFVDIQNLDYLDTTGVTDMSWMFSYETRADVSGFNTSAVTNMEGMFANALMSRILNFSSWDTSNVTNMSRMFQSFEQRNPGNLVFPSSFDTSKVNDMSYMFSATQGNMDNLDLSVFDTRNVTTMEGMFEQSLFRTLNLASFNTQSVTTMRNMFSNVLLLNELVFPASFNTSQVTDMSNMFRRIGRESNAWIDLDLSMFNTSQVMTMQSMFEDSNVLTLNLTSFDTRNVITMRNMFQDVWLLTELDLSSFDTPKVTDMQHMLSGLFMLERLDLSNFDTRSVMQGGMNFMFNHASSLKVLTLGPNIESMVATSLIPNFSPSTDFTGHWQNVGTGTVEIPNGEHIWTAAELQSNFKGSQADTFVWRPELPRILGDVVYSYDTNTRTLTLKGGTITWTSMQNAWGDVPRNQVEHIVFTGNVNVGGNRSLADLFRNMSSLEQIENLSYLDTTGVTNMSMMFNSAVALESLDLSSFDTSTVTSMRDMFGQASSLQEIKGLDAFETEHVRNMEGMFRNTAVHELDLSSFDTGQVTDMNAMFAEMNNIRALDLSSFETSNVRLMTYMFANSRNLEEIDLSTFDTQQVTNMGMMFMNTEQIDKLDLSHFKTENVTDMHHMFAGTRGLEELLLDKDNFDTSSVTDMFRMFAHTHNLKSLDLRGFDTRAVTNMEEMFWLADALTELDLSSFETPALTRMEAMFDGASALRKIDMSSFDTRNVQANNRTRLFSAINALDELRLGANTVITNSDLPTETTSTGLLNSWKRETQGLEAFTGPNTLFDFSTGPIIGNNVLRGPADWLSSQDLMTLSGTAGEATGTWRRVPYQTNVQVKDSSVFIGEDWQPEDNFVSATDREGNNVPLSSITVEGTVDTRTAGTYEVTYTYDDVSATAEITVKESQTSVQVKDSSLFVGEAWNAQDNFVSATDRYGESVDFDRITVEGTVDTDTAGTYKVTYTYDGVSATAEITVKESQTSVNVKNSALFVGESWTAQDNFVSATDRYGESVPFNRIAVEGTVDTRIAGTYKVTYTYDGVEETAQITVKAKGGGDDNGTSSGGGSGNDGSESNNGNGEYGTDTSDEDKDNEEQIASDNKEEELTPTHTDNLPRTGEIVGLLSILGLANLILALTLWLKRRKVK